MESPARFTTKQKIIQAAMNIIAEEGLEKTTVRKIASRAGVNIAAVNYHFGGKDAVINQSFATVTKELRDSFRFLKYIDGQGITNLSMFINEYTDIMCKYPDLLKNAIDLVIRRRVIEVDYLTFLQTEGIDLIESMIGRIRPDLDQLQVHLKALQLISELSYPFLLGDLTREMLGVDLQNPETRRQYTSMVLRSHCQAGC
ncbi:MAG: TetR/AcrR family transcriptional regulator [Syntrophomonadaceae bacterium]